ncbi:MULTISPECIES: hypothetical protein [unclassified Chitinophaga]|uniref:hypothetical protein n=1 Tax=unclassified Chitinophaga TaxID=2619133 RepID=UPI00301048D7
MFETESQLVDVLKKNYRAFCHWDPKKFDTKILEEVDLGYGIADLVISKLAGKKEQSNFPLNYFDALVYKIIETNKSISFEKLKEITKANSSTINGSLKKLIQDSYVAKSDSLFVFHKTYKAVAIDSIAIEAKLKNWKRALDQAFRYKWFADKSYVVLDSNYIKPAISNINEFTKMNVGLAEINLQGEVKLHFKPIKSLPIDYKMWILLNERLKIFKNSSEMISM